MNFDNDPKQASISYQNIKYYVSFIVPINSSYSYFYFGLLENLAFVFKVIFKKILILENHKITVYENYFLNKLSRSHHTFALPVCYPLKSSMCITIIFFSCCYFLCLLYLTCKIYTSWEKIKV